MGKSRVEFLTVAHTTCPTCDAAPTIWCLSPAGMSVPLHSARRKLGLIAWNEGYRQGMLDAIEEILSYPVMLDGIYAVQGRLGMHPAKRRPRDE